MDWICGEALGLSPVVVMIVSHSSSASIADQMTSTAFPCISFRRARCPFQMFLAVVLQVLSAFCEIMRTQSLRMWGRVLNKRVILSQKSATCISGQSACAVSAKLRNEGRAVEAPRAGMAGAEWASGDETRPSTVQGYNVVTRSNTGRV